MTASRHEIAAVEEKLAWCIAVHAPRELIDRLRAALADGQLELVETSANAMLPRARAARVIEPVRPVHEDGGATFDNGLVRAHLNDRGTLLELASPRTRVALAQANLLAAYRDFPKGFNIHAWPKEFELRDDGVEVRFRIGKTPVTMLLEVRRGEPFLRVMCAVDWQLRATLCLENWLAIETKDVKYGTDRHFAAISDERAGLAVFVLDPADWNARALRKGGVHLGASLLHARGPAQPAWAFAPFEPGISMGALEAAWEEFAYEPRVRLFTSEDPAIRVVACKPAADGDGVIVSVREYDGASRLLRLRSGARMREVQSVDSLERPGEGEAAIEGEAIVSRIDADGLRSFRVRF